MTHRKRFSARLSIAMIGGGILAATIAPAVAQDCTEEARKQVHDLATFSKMVGIDHCATAEGRMRYEGNAALLQILNRRNTILNSICPASDARWEYARKTLEIQTRVFVRVSKGCSG